MVDDSSLDSWEAVWQDLQAFAPRMPDQGRELLDLATRLVRANRVLMELPDLEDEAYREVESLSMLIHSLGSPEEKWLLQLIALITHLLDMLYVRLEYIKWDVSPLSALTEAIGELEDQQYLSAGDRELLTFLVAYDEVVRSGRGLADSDRRAELLERLSALDAVQQATAQRRLRSLVDLVGKLLRHYPASRLPEQ